MLLSLWLFYTTLVAAQVNLEPSGIPTSVTFPHPTPQPPKTHTSNDGAVRSSPSFPDPTAQGGPSATDGTLTNPSFSNPTEAPNALSSGVSAQTQTTTTVTVSNPSSPAVLSANASARPSIDKSASAGLRTDVKIGLGVGLGVALLAVAAAIGIGLFYRRRRMNTRYAPTHSTEQLREQPAMATNTRPTYLSVPTAATAARSPSQRSVSRSMQANPAYHPVGEAPPTEASTEQEAQVAPHYENAQQFAPSSAAAAATSIRPQTPRQSRPSVPSILTDAMSPVTDRHTYHDEPVSPVSPVSPISPAGSRPNSLHYRS